MVCGPNFGKNMTAVALTPPLYPTPWTPSSLALDKQRDHSRGATKVTPTPGSWPLAQGIAQQYDCRTRVLCIPLHSTRKQLRPG